MVWEGVVVRWGGIGGCSGEVVWEGLVVRWVVWEGVVMRWGGMGGCSGEVGWYGRAGGGWEGFFHVHQ